MKKLTGILVGIAVVLTAIYIYQLKRENSALKESMTSLQVGESIEYFMVSGEKNQALDLSFFNDNNGQAFALFIFSRPCSPCNSDIPLWNKISRLGKGKLQSLGIILDGPTELTRLAETKRVQFPLFSPIEPQIFLKMFRIKTNLSITLICHKREIVYLKIGPLSAGDFFEIKQKIEEMIQ